MYGSARSRAAGGQNRGSTPSGITRIRSGSTPRSRVASAPVLREFTHTISASRSRPPMRCQRRAAFSSVRSATTSGMTSCSICTHGRGDRRGGLSAGLNTTSACSDLATRREIERQQQIVLAFREAPGRSPHDPPRTNACRQRGVPFRETDDGEIGLAGEGRQHGAQIRANAPVRGAGEVPGVDEHGRRHARTVVVRRAPFARSTARVGDSCLLFACAPFTRTLGVAGQVRTRTYRSGIAQRMRLSAH